MVKRKDFGRRNAINYGIDSCHQLSLIIVLSDILDPKPVI